MQYAPSVMHTDIISNISDERTIGGKMWFFLQHQINDALRGYNPYLPQIMG